jgi:hypothetical protein
MTDMDDICKGCLTHERAGLALSKDRPKITYGECPGYNRVGIDCPCIICLIKMMCDKPCMSFKKRKWRTSLSNLEWKGERIEPCLKI